jgi:hypothetical protein
VTNEVQLEQNSLASLSLVVGGDAVCKIGSYVVAWDLCSNTKPNPYLRVQKVLMGAV